VAGGWENVGHRGVNCFASVSGAAGTAGSQGAAAAALLEALVVSLVLGGRQRDAHARIIAGRSHKADDLYISNDE
jgi:hypothetical protein